MSSPFLYAGLLRVVEPAILLRYSERRVENVVIDGRRAQISRTGAGRTARLDRKRAWIFAMAPTAVIYGGALALSLTLSGTLSPGLVGVMIVSAVLVVAIGPLAMHMRKNLLAARELRTPQASPGPRGSRRPTVSSTGSSTRSDTRSPPRACRSSSSPSATTTPPALPASFAPSSPTLSRAGGPSAASSATRPRSRRAPLCSPRSAASSPPWASSPSTSHSEAPTISSTAIPPSRPIPRSSGPPGA